MQLTSSKVPGIAVEPLKKENEAVETGHGEAARLVICSRRESMTAKGLTSLKMGDVLKDFKTC
jgi:hypothetical protein